MSIDRHASGASRRLATAAVNNNNNSSSSVSRPTTLRAARHGGGSNNNSSRSPVTAVVGGGRSFATAEAYERRRYGAASAAAAAASSSSRIAATTTTTAVVVADAARWRPRAWCRLRCHRVQRAVCTAPRRVLHLLLVLFHVARYLLERAHLRRDPTAALTAHLSSSHMRRVVPLDGVVAARYSDNTVINSRYTAVSFVFRNLYEQFRRPINLYFLLVALLQFISVIAPVNPLTTLLPLTFAFLLTAAKEGYDDVKRHRQDATYNHVPRAVLDAVAGRWVYKRNCEIRVGDVVMLRQNEEVPCDAVLLAATSRAVFIRTDNLDGEMDLKPREVVQPPRRALLQRLRAQRSRQQQQQQLQQQHEATSAPARTTVAATSTDAHDADTDEVSDEQQWVRRTSPSTTTTGSTSVSGSGGAAAAASTSLRAHVSLAVGTSSQDTQQQQQQQQYSMTNNSSVNNNSSSQRHLVEVVSNTSSTVASSREHTAQQQPQQQEQQEQQTNGGGGEFDEAAAVRAMLLSISDEVPALLSKLRRVRLHCPPPNASFDSFNGRAEFVIEPDEYLYEYHHQHNNNSTQASQQQQQQHGSSGSGNSSSRGDAGGHGSVVPVTMHAPDTTPLATQADTMTSIDGTAAMTTRTTAAPLSSSSSSSLPSSTVAVSLSHLHLLPQSSFLKNVERALVVAVYTGDDTKFGMNKRPPPVKWAKIDKLVNVYAMVLFACQLLCAMLFGLIGFLVNRHVSATHWYLPPPSFEAAGSVFVIYPLRFFLLTTTMIPVSFKFIVDMSKYYMAMVVEWDAAMVHGEAGAGGGCKVKNSNILEDLGQIDYVLSDKTGTMTKNVMRLQYIAVQATRQQVAVVDDDGSRGGGNDVEEDATATTTTTREAEAMAKSSMYASRAGKGSDDTGDVYSSSNNNNNVVVQQQQLLVATTPLDKLYSVDSDDTKTAKPTLMSTTKTTTTATMTSSAAALRRVCVALALCNTVDVVTTRDGLDYQATSPDETALCCGVAKLGVRLLARRTLHNGGASMSASGGYGSSTVVLAVDGVQQEWLVHHVFLFSSEHKSMSVLVEEVATHRIWLFVKGADERVHAMTRPRRGTDDGKGSGSTMTTTKMDDNNNKGKDDDDDDDYADYDDLARDEATASLSTAAAAASLPPLTSSSSSMRTRGKPLASGARAQRASASASVTGDSRRHGSRALPSSAQTRHHPPPPPLDVFVRDQLASYANRGLRTLLVAARELTRNELGAFRHALHRAELMTEGRQAAVDAVRAHVQRGVTVLGVTAIEDALQDDVQATVRDLLAADIRVWMITGDKLETAEKIALSCALYAPGDHVLRITEDDYDEHAVVAAAAAAAGGGDGAAMASAAQALGRDEPWVERLMAAELPVPPSSVARRRRGRRAMPRDEDVYNDDNNDDGSDEDDGDDDDDVAARHLAARRVVQRVLNYTDTVDAADDAQSPRRTWQPPQQQHVYAGDADAVVLVDEAAMAPPPTRTRNNNNNNNSMRVPRRRTVLLVQGGAVLQRILSTERLRRKFAALSRHCASVVCARTTPSQKAAIADFVRQQGYMTLAVGDGGNDVAMLQEAHVGVGIAGREGRQASRAADFAITQFSDLRGLIFVHGQQAYVRTAFVIRYSFYKSMLIAFVQLVYNATATRMSGASFWNSFALMMWNGLYTLPQTFLYCLDRPAPRVVLERNPVLYKLTRRNRDMRAGEFFGHHLLLAVVQSSLLIGLTVSLTNSGAAASHEGWASTHDGNFTIAYTALMASQAVVVWLQSHSLTWPNVLCLLAMPLLYLATTLAFSSMPGSTYYGVFVSVLRVDAWLTVLAVCVALVLLFLLFAVCHHGMRPNARTLLCAAERTRQHRLLRNSAYRRTQPLLVRWFGFLPEAASSYLATPGNATAASAVATAAAARAATVMTMTSGGNNNGSNVRPVMY